MSGSSPAAYNFGSRSVLAKKPVKTPEDLAASSPNLPNPVITECLRLMGAAATAAGVR